MGGGTLLCVISVLLLMLLPQFFSCENLYKMQVSPGDVLISPVQCKSLWRQFQGETEYTITQAIAAQVKSLCHILSCLRFLLSL
jgi:hypothetical protein